MQTLPWIVALLALALLAIALALWIWRSSRRRRAQWPVLPTEWALTVRPVFAVDERRVYRLLREAFPQQAVLSKLPLVRFCQPTDPAEVRYWYDLLGNSQVTFAVCSANGRVLAAIDLDSDRSESRRRMQIKQSVLNACRVRYLRCAVDQLPSVTELQSLVPSSVAGSRASQPEAVGSRLTSPGRDDGHAGGATAARRAERTPLWQDSAVLQDSFFTPDSRLDAFDNSSHDNHFPLSAPPAPRAKARSSRRGARPAFNDTDFDPTQFGHNDFDAEPTADEVDDFGNAPARPPSFFSSSRR